MESIDNANNIALIAHLSRPSVRLREPRSRVAGGAKLWRTGLGEDQVSWSIFVVVENNKYKHGQQI